MCGRLFSPFPPKGCGRCSAPRTRWSICHPRGTWRRCRMRSPCAGIARPASGISTCCLGPRAALRQGPEIRAQADQRAGGDCRDIGHVRGRLAKRRCLVPAQAFYEWRAMPSGKQRYAIARADGQPLVFAGLWEGWGELSPVRAARRGAGWPSVSRRTISRPCPSQTACSLEFRPLLVRPM